MKPAQTVVFSIAIRTVCQHRSAYDRGNEGETLDVFLARLIDKSDHMSNKGSRTPCLGGLAGVSSICRAAGLRNLALRQEPFKYKFTKNFILTAFVTIFG